MENPNELTDEEQRVLLGVPKPAPIAAGMMTPMAATGAPAPVLGAQVAPMMAEQGGAPVAPQFPAYNPTDYPGLTQERFDALSPTAQGVIAPNTAPVSPDVPYRSINYGGPADYARYAATLPGGVNPALPGAAPVAPVIGGSPVAPDRSRFADAGSGQLVGFGGPSGSLKGFAPGESGERRMSTNDWRTVNQGKDARRIAELGMRYAGSGDAFTPQGMASRAHLQGTAMTQAGESERATQRMEFDRTMEDIKAGRADHTKTVEWLRSLGEKTGTMDPNEAMGLIREGVRADTARKGSEAVKTGLEADKLQKAAAYYQANGMTQEQAHERAMADDRLTAEARSMGVAPSRLEGWKAQRFQEEQDKKAAELERTRAATERAKKPTEVEQATDLAVRARDGDFDAAKRLNAYLENQARAKGMSANLYPETPEEYAKAYPGRTAKGAGAAKADTSGYEVGKTYSDGAWKGKYLGDGKWEAVK